VWRVPHLWERKQIYSLSALRWSLFAKSEIDYATRLRRKEDCLATYTPEPRGYELMVLLSPELGDEALETEMNRISDQLASTGAEIVRSKSTTPWGRRRLAYPIQNYQDAYYVLYSLTSQPGQLNPFERDLKLNSNVIRYLLIRQEKAEALAEDTETEIEADEPAVGAESDDQTPDGEAGDTDAGPDAEVADESADSPAEDGPDEDQA
jgi:small subunit ribosomal protein S6